MWDDLACVFGDSKPFGDRCWEWISTKVSHAEKNIFNLLNVCYSIKTEPSRCVYATANTRLNQRASSRALNRSINSPFCLIPSSESPFSKSQLAIHRRELPEGNCSRPCCDRSSNSRLEGHSNMGAPLFRLKLDQRHCCSR